MPDATTPTLVEAEKTPECEFDAVRQTPGPLGWTRIEFWAKPSTVQTTVEILRALADKMEAAQP